MYNNFGLLTTITLYTADHNNFIAWGAHVTGSEELSVSVLTLVVGTASDALLLVVVAVVASLLQLFEAGS